MSEKADSSPASTPEPLSDSKRKRMDGLIALAKKLDTAIATGERHLALANTGGAFATLSFAGALIAGGGRAWLSIFPLFFFLVGILLIVVSHITKLAGTLSNTTQSFDEYFSDLSKERGVKDSEWNLSRFYELLDQVASHHPSTVLFSCLFFILGCTSGFLVFCIVTIYY